MFETLGCAIVAGAYPRNKLPTEAKLAEQYGVSRSVAREAVKMLTSKGLLSARPRLGTIVEPSLNWSLLDRDVLRWLGQQHDAAELLNDLNEVRFAIEPEAAALAALMARADDLHALSISIIAMEAGVDGANMLNAQLAFHTTVRRASANPFYAGLSETTRTALRVASRKNDPAANRVADTDGYTAVRDAIASRDAVAARRSMRALIANSRMTLPVAPRDG